MKSGMVCWLGVAVLVLAGMGVWAQPPAQIDYQGKILVSDIPLTGDGYFKYAISDEAATTNYWSQDGTDTGEPLTWLTNDCYNGVFSTALGAAPMNAIDPAIFAVDTALYLRVWFSSDEVTFNEMLPAQRLLSAPYAINADTLDGYHAIDLLGGSITETDPVFRASAAFGITTGGIANWNTAFGWGDHALAGYLTTESDPVFAASDAFGITTAAISQWDEAYSWGDHSSEGYLKQFDFSDFSAVSGIDSSSVSWWDEAYSWGDHSLAGYALQSDFSDYSSVTMIGSSDISNWDEAYNWGDHSLAGYLASESDPVWTAASTGYYQKTQADARYVEVAGDTMTGALAIDDAASGTLKLDSSLTNIAVGAAASAAGGTERIAIGHEVTNSVDNTARIRGAFYMDGGDSVWARSTFGTGSFEQLLPLPDIQNIVYVATNGSPVGPGTIDRPFDTPQNGYNYAATTYPMVPSALVIAAGTHPGLIMHAGSVHVFGVSRPELVDLTVSAFAVGISGKQRVENIIVKGETTVAADEGADVKFHNCRMEFGLEIQGSNVEVQDCFVTTTADEWATMLFGAADVAFYNSSFVNNSPTFGTIMVAGGIPNVEIMGCQIQNKGGGACIEDQETGPIWRTHLYTHNVLHGAEPGVGTTPAMHDPFAGMAGPTITFTHNLVMGHVGISGNSQFYANNTVYGLINNVGAVPGTPGWTQAGTGTGADAAGNIEHETSYPMLPSPWLD